jgi:hypothetical protein
MHPGMQCFVDSPYIQGRTIQYGTLSYKISGENIGLFVGLIAVSWFVSKP